MKQEKQTSNLKEEETLQVKSVEQEILMEMFVEQEM